MKKIFLLCLAIFMLTISAYGDEVGIGINIPQEIKQEQNKEFDWTPYLTELDKRIKENWNTTSEDAGGYARVLISIQRDGQLISNTLAMSSGSKNYDSKTKEAIILSAPFKPLPSEYKGSTVDIELTFDYKLNNKESAKISSKILPYNKADWGPYMRDLERRIKRNWNPPKGDESKRIVVAFTVNRDGSLSNTKIIKSSGSEACDKAAKKAIDLTAPFKTLPEEFKGNKIDIEFTFDYNVFGARRSEPEKNNYPIPDYLEQYKSYGNKDIKYSTKKQEDKYYDYIDKMKKMK